MEGLFISIERVNKPILYHSGRSAHTHTTFFVVVRCGCCLCLLWCLFGIFDKLLLLFGRASTMQQVSKSVSPPKQWVYTSLTGPYSSESKPANLFTCIPGVV